MDLFENSPEDFSSFFENTPALVCVASEDGFFKSINKAVVNKLGYTKEELLSIPIFSLIYPDDKELTSKTRQEMLLGKPLINFENRYITKSGEIIWFQWTSIFLPHKKMVFAIAKDITEKKKIEKEVIE